MSLQFLNAKSASTDVSICDNTTVGNVSIGQFLTSGILSIGTSASRTGQISIGNSAVAGAAIKISAGGGGTSALTLQGANGITLSNATTVNGLLSATAGLTNTGGVLSSTSGITFGGSTLSVYTEGTFTPAISIVGGSGVTIATNTGSGQYTRVGDIVYVWGTLSLSITAGTWTGVELTGLPVTVNGSGFALMVHNCTAFGYPGDTTKEKRAIHLTDATTKGTFYFEPKAGNSPMVNVDDTYWAGTGTYELQFQGTYFA